MSSFFSTPVSLEEAEKAYISIKSEHDRLHRNIDQSKYIVFHVRFHHPGVTLRFHFRIKWLFEGLTCWLWVCPLVGGVLVAGRCRDSYMLSVLFGRMYYPHGGVSYSRDCCDIISRTKKPEIFLKPRDDFYFKRIIKPIYG